jgi:tRNA-dihydrouridine synthase B
MAEAAVLALEASGADILDINMGCPVNKVVKSGDGSALMKDPDLAGRIIRSVADAVSVPVTVKIRKGFDGGNVNAVEFAKMCEDSGASAVAVHGRTRVQMYQGRADWDIIREVRKALAIPVIANGDALTAEEAVHLLRYTGCPAAMIGRGSFGNPWIFRQAEAILRGEECPALPELPLRLDTAVRQIEMLEEQTNEHYACLQARHQLPWYLHGVPHSGPFRQRFAKVSSLEELREITCEAGTRLSNPHISRNLNV